MMRVAGAVSGELARQIFPRVIDKFAAALSAHFPEVRGGNVIQHSGQFIGIAAPPVLSTGRRPDMIAAFESHVGT